MKIVALVVVLCGVARADERAPRQLWVGLNGGMVMGTTYDDFVMQDEISVGGALGLDVGFSKTFHASALDVQADVLPVGGIYKARAGLLLGYGTTWKYTLPCAAPTGMTCSEIYNYRDVKTVLGLRLGAEVGTSPKGTAEILEAGFGLHGQIQTSMSFAFDVGKSQPGMALDFAWQFGPAYVGLEMLAMFDKTSTYPLLMVMSVGYALPMW